MSVPCSVKSCFQNMDICKRRCTAFDNNKNLFAGNGAPSGAANLTVTFSSQLNQHSQVPVPRHTAGWSHLTRPNPISTPYPSPLF